MRRIWAAVLCATAVLVALAWAPPQAQAYAVEYNLNCTVNRSIATACGTSFFGIPRSTTRYYARGLASYDPPSFPTGVTFDEGLAGSGSGSTYQPYLTGTISGTVGSTYLFTLRRADPGGDTTIREYRLTVVAATPVVNSASTASGTVGSAFSTYTITATNTPTSFSATGLPAGLSVDTSNGQITGTPTSAGTSTVTIRATNSDGTGTKTLTITVAKATPVITWSTPASITYGTALSSTQLNATAAVGGASVPGTFTYSPASGTVLSVGTTTLSVGFVPTDTTNYNSVASTTVNQVVTALAARTPTFGSVTSTVGGFTVPITNYDPDFTWGATASSGSTSLNASSGLVTVTGLATGASSTVTVTTSRTGYTGGTGTTSGSAIAAPTISSASTASGVYGSLLSTYTITATNTPTSYNATGLPAGLSVNTSSGEITGTPTTAGSFTVTISATNAASTGSAVLTLTIDKATPVITWSTPASITYGTALSSTQLNATAAVGGASVPGTFTYSPASGTVLSVGTTTLSVGFVPTDTTNYNSVASTTVNQVVGLAAQNITWSPTLSVVITASPLTFAAAVSDGPGSVTYAVTDPGLTSCLIATPSDPILTFGSTGSCQVTATSAATSTHASATSVKVFTITAPSPGGRGSGSNSEAPPTAALTPPTATQGLVVDPSPTKSLRLPPAPRAVNLTDLPGCSATRIRTHLAAHQEDAPVSQTVIVVMDKNELVVSRIAVDVDISDAHVTVEVPYVAPGYRVISYNVNAVGVSAGAPPGSSILNRPTMAGLDKDGAPNLFGASAGESITFASGSSTIDSRNQRKLKKLAAELRGSSDRIFITGFAMPGARSTSKLRELALERARNVALYLSQQGVQTWIRYSAAGTTGTSGTWRDRRVEIRRSADTLPANMV